MSILESSVWSGKVFSDGWRASAHGTAPVVSPGSGEALGLVGTGGPAEMAAACESAAAAQRDWAKRTYIERGQVLHRAAQLFEAHQPELASWLVRESGSVRSKAGVEIAGSARHCYEAASLASHALGDVLPSREPRLSFTRHRPAGVVGVIAPFNFPMYLAIRSVAPALALGNAVVLKPDPRTAVSGGVAIARIFEEAGLPSGVLHVIPGDAEAGAALVTEPSVRIISFTGSTDAGRAVAELAGRHLKRAHLELGGNSALLVLDDVDVRAAATAGAWGSFTHQGQICMSTGRHLVHERIADEYIEALAEVASALTVGNPEDEHTDLGPIIDRRQLSRIEGVVSDSVRQGARLVAGGTAEGLFYRPTVLSEVGPETSAFHTETFGPVAPVVRFSTIDEAIELARATEFGLALGVLTRDIARGLSLADQIPTGIVHINDQTVSDEAIVPFGGVADSGNGVRLGGTSNIDAFTERQWLTIRGDLPYFPFQQRS